MSKSMIALISVVAIILIGSIVMLSVLLNKANSEKNELAKAGSSNVSPAPCDDPCADTTQLRLDAEQAEKIAADAAKDAKFKRQALKNVLKKCGPNFQNGDTSYVVIINKGASSGTSGKRNANSNAGNQQSSSATTPGRQVSSSYTGPEQPVVVQNYKQSSAGAQQFLWNIQADANGRPHQDKNWPHLEDAANPNKFVPEAVSNGQRGYNVSMVSVPEFSTSYGYDLSKQVMWILCSILDNPKFGAATNVVASGDFLGWAWQPATIENVGGKSYYVVRW